MRTRGERVMDRAVGLFTLVLYGTATAVYLPRGDWQGWLCLAVSVGLALLLAEDVVRRSADEPADPARHGAEGGEQR